MFGERTWRTAPWPLVLAMLVGAAANADTRLVYGGDDDFPPYEWKGPDGGAQGFNVELMRALGRHLERDVEVRLDAWSRIREAFETKRTVDVVDMYASARRLELFDFTEPFDVAYSELFVRRDTARPCDPEDLAGRRVLVEAGAHAAEYLATQHPAAKPVLATSEVDALRRLAAGDGDCALASQVAGRHIARTRGYANLVVHGAPLNPQPYAFAVRKGEAELLTDLNRALAAVRASGEYDALRARWFEPGVELAQPTLGAVLSRSLVVLGPVAALALMLFAWTFALRRQVRERTKALQDELERREKSEADAREREQRFRSLMQHAAEAILVVDAATGEVLEASQRAAALVGLSDDALRARGLDALCAGSSPALSDAVHRAQADEVRVFEWRHEPSQTDCEVRLTVLPSRGRQLVRVSLIDVSERRRLFERHAQSQRFEAVGRLAGGVAHDFNNLLNVISLNAELLRLAQGSGQANESARDILDATERAGGLTKRLLAFARLQPAAPQRLELVHVVTGLKKLLGALLGDGVELRLELDAPGEQVLADETQLEQVLLNLAVNARDAMHGQGRLVVRVHRAPPDTAGLPPGDWLVLDVDDTGPGVPAELRRHIFEPFFTTKASKGTGLGLATVHGIAVGLGGGVSVGDAPGGGARFRVWLPGVDPAADAPRRPAHDGPQRPQPELRRVLLVEDDDSVRRTLARMLEVSGLEVLAVAGPAEALEAAARSPAPDVVLSDITMPGMTGLDLMERLRETHPALRVVLMSGFTADESLLRGELPPRTAFISKPFQMSELLDAFARLEPDGVKAPGA